MSQGVAVGFSPAGVPVVTGGMAAAAPAEGEAAAGGLFAALLSMIGDEPPTIEGDAIPAVLAMAKEGAAPSPPALLFDMAKAVPVTDAELQEQLQGTKEGTALFKTLGDALVALKDSVDAGQPPDPALEHKLDEALDAVAAYLGLTLPTSQPMMPVISAQASGAGVLPAIESASAAGTGVPGNTPAAAEPVSKSTLLPLAAGEVSVVAPGAAATSPLVRAGSDEIPVTEVAAAPRATEVAKLAAASGATLIGRVTEVAAADPATEVAEAPIATEVEPMSSAASEPVAEDISAPILKLAKLLEGLADKVAQQSPELAKKLEALAEQLKAGKLPDALAAALNGDGDGAPEAQLQRIIDALSAPPIKASPTPAVTAQPFVVPSLALPDRLSSADRPEKPTRVETPGATDIGPAEAAPADRPAPRVKLSGDPEPKAQATEHKASSAPATAAKPDPATAMPGDASGAPPQAAGLAVTTAARAVHAAYQAPVQQVNLPQVAFEVVRQFQAGNSRFQIRLDPPELGRIEVKLEVDKAGTVNARMTVERPETLDLMQRDQRALQQALQQAGLDSAKTSLEFSLRQNPFAQQQGMGDGRGQQPAFAPGGGRLASDEGGDVTTPTNLYRGTATAGGVNLFV